MATDSRKGARYYGGILHEDGRQDSKVVQTSHSLRWNLAASDSLNASHTEATQVGPKILKASSSPRPAPDSPNVSHAEEEVTLCYVPPTSECDLTACTSTASGLKIKALPVASSLEFFLPQLPEIPDWYEDEQPKQNSPPPVEILGSDTPQSDYHSFEDFYPASPCPDDGATFAIEEEATTQINDVVPPESHGLSESKPKAEQLPRPRPAQPRPRSHSLNSADQRPAQLTFALPHDAGSGYGLGSPFSPCPISSGPHLTPTPIDLGLGLDLHPGPRNPVGSTSPTLSFTAHPNLHLNHRWQTPPGLRREEALAVWRPRGPVATHLDGRSPVSDLDSDSDDARSLEQPFPSSASIWVLVLDQPQPSPVPASQAMASTAPRMDRREDTQTQTQTQKWTLEEQITIAVLAAMDSRDMRGRSACHARLSAGGRKSKFRRLLGRIWR
ncbi:hypothetical protein B0H11DRAFT_1971321 [Mycena galericulata]|nr:hypothetical protein B0H11DRAFT_1971321 [Mycena galericulata]